MTRLVTYDKELSKTLYSYLRNNGSQAKTAKELWIHRSSLIYRLKKIEEVLDIQLDDYKTRLHLQLSYEIFNYLHSEHIYDASIIKKRNRNSKLLSFLSYLILSSSFGKLAIVKCWKARNRRCVCCTSQL